MVQVSNLSNLSNGQLFTYFDYYERVARKWESEVRFNQKLEYPNNTLERWDRYFALGKFSYYSEKSKCCIRQLKRPTQTVAN
jgi:hypothetical protein